MAVDWAGCWYEDPSVPEEKWNDYDYMAWYIRKVGYEPKTDMENLISMVLLHYEAYLEEHEVVSYVDDEDRRPYPMCLMINWNDVGVFVNESGGWEEFDYVA